MSRFAPKHKLKKGDVVTAITGSDKNKEGEIIELFPVKNKAIVKGFNIKKKHVKPTNEDAGGIKEIEAPIDLSNLMYVYDHADGKPLASKLGIREEGGKRVRFVKKTGNTI